MIVLNFFRNIVGTLIFGFAGTLLMVAFPILAPSGRKFIKEGMLAALIEHLTGTPATTSKDILVARVEDREKQ